MKQRITSLQATVIIVLAIVPSSFLYIPSFVIQISKQDGWISVLLTLAVSLLLAVVIGYICREGERKPLLEWLRSRFGKGIATVIGLFLCGYYGITAAAVVRQFSSFMSDQTLLSTPLFMLIAIIVLVSGYIASQGIESLSRVLFVVFLFFGLSVGVNVIFIYGQLDFQQFLPIMESTPNQYIASSFMPLGCLSGIAVLLLLLPYLEKAASAIKVAVWGTVISGLLIALVTAVTIAVFGSKIIGVISYPAFAAIGTVEIGQFIERVEVLLVSAWSVSMFAQVSVFMYGFFQLVSQTFKLTTHFTHHIACGICILATALFAWPSSLAVTEFSYTTLVIYFLLNNYAISLMIWCGLHLTRHKVRSSEESV